jgi:hypothetical protein
MAYGVSPFFARCMIFLANFNLKLRTPDLDAVGLCAGHTGLCTVADLLRLQFRQRRKQREQDVSH